MCSHPQFEFAQISRPILDALPFGLVVLDRLGHIVWTSRGWQVIGQRDDGSEPELAVGDRYIDGVGQYLSLSAQDVESLSEGLTTLFTKQSDQCAFQFTSRHNDTVRGLTVRAIAVSNAGSRLVLMIHQENGMPGVTNLPAELFREAVESVDEPFLIADSNGKIQYANGAHVRISGFSLDEAVGHSIWSLAGDERDPALEDAAWNALRAGKSWREELSIRRKDGEIRWESQTISPLFDSSKRLRHLVSIGRDVTDHRAYVDELRRHAYHDALTGLPNRALFLDRLAHAHTRVRRGNQPLAIMFLDLNGFKSVNDRFGHQIGDAVLIEVATRLVGCLRASDTVARSGGDEFIFLLEEVATDSDALAVARRIVSEISRPIEIDGSSLAISGSVGIAFNTPAIADPEVLLRQSDIALYHAKAKRDHQFVVYRENMTMPRPQRS